MLVLESERADLEAFILDGEISESPILDV